MFGDGRVQHVAILNAIPQAEDTGLAVVGAATGEDRNGSSAHVVTTRGIVVVLAAGVDGLDDILSIGTIVGFDAGCAVGREDGRGERKCMEVGTFG